MKIISIKPIAILSDNYAWCIHFEGFKAAIVDPGESKPVYDYLLTNGLDLVAIFLTHHHLDHSGGIEGLKRRWPSVAMCTHANNKRVTPNKDSEFFGFEMQSIPGHTLDHVWFKNAEIIFTGDTLFNFGCGRVFEGDYRMFYDALIKIKSLPPSLKVYTGHEYTLKNLDFAKAVEPDNAIIQDKINATIHAIQQGLTSQPTFLSDELLINPFLRCHESSIKQAAEKYVGELLSSELAVFTALRRWKDNF